MTSSAMIKKFLISANYQLVSISLGLWCNVYWLKLQKSFKHNFSGDFNFFLIEDTTIGFCSGLGWQIKDFGNDICHISLWLFKIWDNKNVDYCIP